MTVLSACTCRCCQHAHVGVGVVSMHMTVLSACSCRCCQHAHDGVVSMLMSVLSACSCRCCHVHERARSCARDCVFLL